jgi:glyoxylase-like metal-dependent hydrolase (beta-lactamase superfamily II)
MLHDETSGAVSYLLADLDTRECVLVDARSADLSVLRAMLDEHGLHLARLLRTHEHDGRLAEEAAALDWLGATDNQQALTGQPLSALSPQSPQSPHGEPGTLVFGNELLRVLPTPGHTAGCLSFLWRDRLFCGDLLSVDACPLQPRPAQPEALWDSATRQVFTLPGETLLFCAHASRGRAVSSVLEQRRWHPWLGGATRDEFLARVRTPGTLGDDEPC